MTHSPRMSSNASIFADRGDPWVSGREGREKFGRNLSSENPDQDAYLFAGRSKKFDGEKIRKAKKPVEKDDELRRSVSRTLSLKRKCKVVDTPLDTDEALAKLEGVRRD